MQRLAAILFSLILATTSTAATFAASSMATVETVGQYISHLKLKPENLAAIVDKQVVVRGVSTKNDKEIAALGVFIADATPEGFIESYRSLATFKQNPYILACGKFSARPSTADLEGLTVDDSDLLALLRATPRDSDIKLSENEIARLRAIAPANSRLTPQLKTRLASEFKKVLAERVSSYLSSGASGLGVYADKEDSVNAHETFAGLAREQAESENNCEHLYSHLQSFPQNAPPDSESFIYWAKQRFGELKTVINVVHVFIHRCGGRVYIASKQLYSTHYTDAGLTVAELIPFTDDAKQPRTIVAYTLRLHVDMLGGSFGFMKKRMAVPKVLSTLKQSLAGMRTTMETLSRNTAQNLASQ